MMLGNPTSALRSFGRKLRLPVIVLTVIAATPRANVPVVSAADAAPLPPVAAKVAKTAAAAPVAVPAVQKAMPAVVRDVRGLSPQVLAMALDAVACARAKGVDGRNDLLTVIDYSLPSTQPRLWVLDLEKGKVLFHELVAHGQGTGEKYATRFSNVKDSKQTSLGLFLTGGTYQGGNGYSLKLKGLDKGINDRAEERHIVIHGAWYVSTEHARQQGRLGRSWGCPALSQASARTVIDTIKGGSFVFSYAGDKTWFRTASSSLNSCGASGGGSLVNAEAAK